MFKLRYNYIAKQENLNEEIRAFLRTIDVLSLPNPPKHYQTRSTISNSLIEQYMKTIGTWNIKTLARKYIYDFELFNYPLSKYLLPKPNDAL